jgi:DNA-binding GntR family transcriptional regulator
MGRETEGIASVQVPAFRLVNQTVYGALRKAIFSGAFQPGDRIVEAEMARKLGISRAPVREALNRLRQAGLVEHRPRRGWFVIGLTQEDLWDLYHARAYIEGLAARRVAASASPEILARLEALLAKMMAAADRQDVDELVANDVRFHELIVTSGGSNQLHRIWRLLHPQDWTIMSVIRLTDIVPAEIAKRHRVVLDALASGDPEWAEAVVKRHILELARQVVHLPAGSAAEALTPVDAQVDPAGKDGDA